MLRAFGALCIAASLASGCSSTGEQDPASSTTSPPTSVGGAESELSQGATSLRIGTVKNTAVPTAALDDRVADALRSAADLSDDGVAITIEAVQIDALEDIDQAIAALQQLGVTVVATLCDSGTTEALADAGEDAGLLVITACAALPLPVVRTSSLVLDAASLADSAATTAAATAEILGSDASVGVLRSELVDDVSDSCLDVEDALRSEGLAVTAVSAFTELIDSPVDVVGALGEPLATVDGIVLCALPPAVGDFVDSLRATNFTAPVIVPWYGDEQVWSPQTNDVWVVAPTSRFGDDPVPEVNQFYAELGDPRAVDVIAADIVAILSAGVARTGAANPSRLVDVLSVAEVDAPGGTVSLRDVGASVVVTRTYRAIQVTAGEPAYDFSVTAS